MLIRRGLPVTPEHRAIDAIMTKLEMYDDLANTEKSTLAEYVEGLEDELAACIRAANEQGWNGVENSKILSVFLGSLVHDTAERCARICETAEVLLPIEVWQGSKKKLTVALADKLAAMIRREFDIGYLDDPKQQFHGSRCGGCEICGPHDDAALHVCPGCGEPGHDPGEHELYPEDL
jgi:hypothetical protein